MSNQEIAPYQHRDTSGRPTLCTQQQMEAFLEISRIGGTPSIAAQCTGVTLHDYNNWMRWGADGIEPFLTFKMLLAKGNAEFFATQMGYIAKHAQTDWRAAKSLLAGKFPSDLNSNGARIQIDQQLNINQSPIDRIMSMSNQILEQMSSGAIGLDDAKIAMAAIEQTRRVAETLQIKERIDSIESTIKDAGHK